MTTFTKKISVVTTAVGIALLSACSSNPAPPAATADAAVSGNGLDGHGGLPNDVLKCCTVSPEDFKHWFANGVPAANGMVTNPNAVTLIHDSNCQFYQYAERMFLWINSPVSSAAPGGPRIFQSNQFYDVTPAGADGTRNLVAHTTPGYIPRLMGHINQTGPHKLPVFLDVNKKLYEVVNPATMGTKKAMVLSGNGPATEVAAVEQGPGNNYIFRDKAGKEIPNPKPVNLLNSKSERIAYRYKAGNKYIFKDINGKTITPLVPSEEGQATGDALIDQNGSMVYYMIMVNDVYAYFLTGGRKPYKTISNSQFPTTGEEMRKICEFARKNFGDTLTDSTALAVELKTSWVKVSTLRDPESYIQMKAIVPRYNTSNPDQWITNGEDTVTLAMIGMHIVGSINHHPEMVWATFEHKNNAPNGQYKYITQKGDTILVRQDTGTHWLLANTTAAASVDTVYNVSHVKIGGSNSAADTLVASSPSYHIRSSNTLRASPWGSSFDSITNNQDNSSARSNSNIISINNSIQDMLAKLGGKDARANYLQIGATWTNDGTAPNGLSYNAGVAPGQDTGYAIGTSALANSTMETYIQTPGNSCFTCHSVGTPDFIFNKNFTPNLSPDTLSHIFTAINPLPKSPAGLKK